MASVRPSPANTSLSSTLKLPPSKVRALIFFSHKPRNGRPEPVVPIQRQTGSASSWDVRRGTRADLFFLSVMRSLSLSSKRSPRPWPLAAASIPPMELSTVPGARAKDITLLLAAPIEESIPLPEPEPTPTWGRLATPCFPAEPERDDAVVSTDTVDAVTSTLSETDPTCSCPLMWLAPGPKFALL